MWSGWGIRTLSAGHVAYNPFSYQVGSVWPHDNAIIAAGFHNYGLDAEASQVARGLFDAAARFDSRRLPELFAGLERDAGSFPVQYLGANVPQAWSSAAVVHLISVFAGLEADAPNHTLRLRPALPPWLGDLHLDNLTVGDASVDLHITRHPDGTHAVDIGERHGELEVILDIDASNSPSADAGDLSDESHRPTARSRSIRWQGNRLQTQSSRIFRSWSLPTGAGPIGVPRCPESACSTASIASMRIVLMQIVSRSPVGRVASMSGLLLVVATEAFAHGG